MPEADNATHLSHHPRAASSVEHLSRLRQFVLAILVGAIGVPLTTLIVNVIVDPWLHFRTGLYPPAVQADDVTKLELVERMRTSPQIVVLGSSRARALEPKYLGSRTGKRVFNAAVAAGTTADAWVFVHFIDARFPDPARRYIWRVDPPLGSLYVKPTLRGDPRAKPYLPAGLPEGRSLLDRIFDYMSVGATLDSLRVLRNCILGCTPITYEADGTIAREGGGGSQGHVDRLRARVRSQVARMRRLLPEPGDAHLQYFSKLIEYMAANDAPPVLILTPMHPAALAMLRRLGDHRRERAVQDLRRLQQRLRFTFFDLTDIRRFNGDADDFNDISHMGVANMRRLVDYVVSHSPEPL